MALAATSGATDAIGYLVLGHIFTSAMTGNLVLLAISIGHPDGIRTGAVMVPLICFAVGVGLGAHIVHSAQSDGPLWPKPVTTALQVEVPIFAAYAICWWATNAKPAPTVQFVLLGTGALALGIQSSAMLSVASGLNTTFLSGALTNLVGKLATGQHLHDVRHHLLVILGLVSGGAIATTLARHAPMWTPLVQLFGLAVALLAAHRLNRIQAT